MNFRNMWGTQIVSNIKTEVVIHILQFLCELKLEVLNFPPQQNSLQVSEFSRNQVPEFPTFSRHVNLPSTAYSDNELLVTV